MKSICVHSRSFAAKTVFAAQKSIRVHSRSFAAKTVFAAVIILSSCAAPPERARVDLQLASEIAKIKAVDNHAHPVRPTLEGEAPDHEYDALPVESLEAQSDTIRTRPTAPEVLDAHRDIFHGDKPAAMKKYGRDYAVQVLDQLNIQTMLANRVALGPGLPSPRFLWVPFADALMYPLPTDSIVHNSDQKAFFALEENLLKRYYAESGVSSRPATLDEYLDKVVRATLQRHKNAGAVAEKFEMAYLRSLDIGNPSKADAEKFYARASSDLSKASGGLSKTSGGGNQASGGLIKAPGDLSGASGGLIKASGDLSNASGDYKALQDYIFRFIAAECGRLGMAVHFHTGAGGGGYFNVAGSNPMLLEPLFNDPALRKTNFVMLHGGWPFEHQLTALLTKPNVYFDFSAQTFTNYPHAVADAMREWLEYVPEKVMFATDAYPFAPPDAGWEEAGYVANQTGREALGIALTAMLRDNEITRDRAVELARMALRDNARKLYGLK
jgi:hypothetical protein